MSFADVDSLDAAFRVCVDRVGENRAISGRVFSRRLTEPLAFFDLGELLLRLDGVLEVQGFPQAFQRARTFGPHHEGIDAPAAEALGGGMSGDEVGAAQGAAATFSLNITSRRNSSWQGMVDWLDGSPRQKFSSALELLKLAQGKLT